MADPNPVNRPPQQSGGWGIGKTLAIVLAPILIIALSCLGLCSGIVFFARVPFQSAMERAGVDIRNIVPEPATDWNDWMVRRELTHLYQTALESVDSDTSLKEKLGDPIEAVTETDDLFRRQNKGLLNLSGEHISFDVHGPKGGGKVTVVSTSKRADGIQPEKITVTLSDGSALDVRPIHRPLPPVR